MSGFYIERMSKMFKNIRSNDKLFEMINIIQIVIITGSAGITQPSIKTYFIGHADQTIIALADLIELGLGTMILFGSTRARVIDVFRKYCIPIMLTDTFLYGIISFAGVDNVSIRFLCMAIINGLFTTTIATVINNVVNSRYDGEKLTIFNSKMKLTASISSFTALSIFIALIGEIDIEIAITIRWIGLMMASVLDSISLKYFDRTDEKRAAEKSK